MRTFILFVLAMMLVHIKLCNSMPAGSESIEIQDPQAASAETDVSSDAEGSVPGEESYEQGQNVGDGENDVDNIELSANEEEQTVTDESQEQATESPSSETVVVTDQMEDLITGASLDSVSETMNNELLEENLSTSVVPIVNEQQSVSPETTPAAQILSEKDVVSTELPTEENTETISEFQALLQKVDIKVTVAPENIQGETQSQETEKVTTVSVETEESGEEELESEDNEQTEAAMTEMAEDEQEEEIKDDENIDSEVKDEISSVKNDVEQLALTEQPTKAPLMLASGLESTLANTGEPTEAQVNESTVQILAENVEETTNEPTEKVTVNPTTTHIMEHVSTSTEKLEETEATAPEKVIKETLLVGEEKTTDSSNTKSDVTEPINNSEEVPTRETEEPKPVSQANTEEETESEVPAMKLFSFDLPIFNESLHRELLMNESEWAKELAAAAHPDEDNTIHDPCTFISENIHNVVGLNVTKEQIQNTLPTFRFLLNANTEELTTIKDMLLTCVEASTKSQESTDSGCLQIRSLIAKTCHEIDLCRGKEDYVMSRAMQRIREVIDTDQLADALLMSIRPEPYNICARMTGSRQSTDVDVCSISES